MNSAVIRISTEKDDRDGEREIEQQRRQRQDQHHQDRHHADGERDVAAPQHACRGRQAEKTPAACRRARPKLRRSCRLIGPVGCGRVFRSFARRPAGRRHGRVEPRWRPRLPPKVRWKRLTLPPPAKCAGYMVTGGLTADALRY